MRRLYFDTSAINWLADEPKRSLIFKALSQDACSISIFTVVELASTPNDARRIHLLSTAKQLTGDYRPLAMPGEILSRSASAFINREETMNPSMGEDWDGIWHALCDPTLIDKQALNEAQAWKSKQQKWYQDMHEIGRPYVQADMSRLSEPERKWIVQFPSRLLKHFARNREFLLHIVSDLAPSTITVSREIAEGIIDNLEPWRFFLAAMAYGMYSRSLQINGYGKQSNPGSIDTQQAIYLAGCDVFVTADEGRQSGPWGGQLAMMRMILPFGTQHREVWHFNRLVEMCSA